MELSEEWQALEATIGMRPRVPGDTILEIREEVAKLSVNRPILDFKGVDIEDHQLDGFKVRSYLPTISNTTVPLGIYIHGGGYCLGDLDTEAELTALLASSAPMAFVAVDYRLAPENPWPSSLNDCATSVLWAINHFSSSTTVDTTSLFVVGGSAGGQFSLALTIKLLERATPIVPKGVIAICPITIGPSAVVPSDLKGRHQSLDECADGALIDKRLYLKFLKWNNANDSDLYFSVLLNPTLKKFPKIYVVTCGADVLRDDGLLLVERLNEYGVEVKHDNYPGYPHYFWSVPGLKKNDVFKGNLVKGLEFLMAK